MPIIILLFVPEDLYSEDNILLFQATQNYILNQMYLDDIRI